MEFKMQQTKVEIIQSLVESATLFKRIRARLGGWVKLGDFIPQGYTGPITFYLFKCHLCKQLSADHVHGYCRLHCHRCNSKP